MVGRARVESNPEQDRAANWLTHGSCTYCTARCDLQLHPMRFPADLTGEMNE